MQIVNILPTVLLGLRASLKEDIKCSDLVLGTPLRLPAKFFVNENPSLDPQIFIEHLPIYAQSSPHIITPHQTQAFIFKDLYSCSHVFI